MSGYRKGKRGPRKRARPKAPEGAAPEGAAARLKRGSGLRDKIAVLVAAAILIPIVVFAFLSLSRSDEPDQQSAAPTMPPVVAGPTAAIVDQLSLTQPNPAFGETARDLLEQAGYAVDYYPGEEVTVPFYRDLPARGYELLLLRAHSSPTGTGEEATDDASLYTTESYSDTKYLGDQVAKRLSIVSYHEGGPEYFGITPEFARSSMGGNFDGATIILMGCDALRSDTLAEAFVRRGAQAVVGWSGPVSASQTDAATERLLRHLLIDGLTTQEAVAQTMAEVGPDPSYESALRLYLSEERASAVP